MTRCSAVPSARGLSEELTDDLVFKRNLIGKLLGKGSRALSSTRWTLFIPLNLVSRENPFALRSKALPWLHANALVAAERFGHLF